MFEKLEAAAPDPILGLSAAFREDPNPHKVNLGVGEYRDAQGKTPVLEAVREAERRLLAAETTKTYLPIDGTPEFGRSVRELLFGDSAPEVEAAANTVTVQAPGGTGALRLAGDFLHRLFPDARLWLSEPTWANHAKVFEAAGLPMMTYPYFDRDTSLLDFDAMHRSLETIPAGDVILLHGCCHNPTGADPTRDQWQRIARTLASRGAVPLVDFAYQGLGTGLREDAVGLQELCDATEELFVASSFSKNFGLYKERAGALTALSASSGTAESVLSHLKVCARTNFSNPPAHGSAIVTEVLGDPELRGCWERELDGMRDRINDMRRQFVRRLKGCGVDTDFSFIERQRGMFSFSGLAPEQVAELRERDSVYIVGSGRINVAGLTEENLDRVCAGIARVL